MSTALATVEPVQLPRWRELVWPKEHGSWSLALEPLALGLLIAPSWTGAALAVAVVAGFFARRPLRIAVSDNRVERRIAARRAVVACGAVALSAWVAALFAGGVAWTLWLIPTIVAGAVFLFFDLQRAGREAQAEVAGALAFAWLPAVFGILVGWPVPSALALAAVMFARAVPTVLTVRATVRARKNGTHRVAAPLGVAVAAALMIAALSQTGFAPRTAAIATIVLAVRSFALLVFPRPSLRASTIGMIETGLGVAYVTAIAVAW